MEGYVAGRSKRGGAERGQGFYSRSVRERGASMGTVLQAGTEAIVPGIDCVERGHGQHRHNADRLTLEERMLVLATVICPGLPARSTGYVVCG